MRFSLNWVPDIEEQGQSHKKAEVKFSSPEKKEKKMRIDQVEEWIDKILLSEEHLLVSFVFSIAVDPLFFYLLVINEERKCVVLDKKLYFISICLRTVLDSISLVNIIWQCFNQSKYIKKNVDHPQGQDGVPYDKDVWSKAKRRYFWSLAIEVMAILPITQVVVPIFISSEMRGSNAFVLNTVVLFQYVPRITRIYLYRRKVWKNTTLTPNEKILLKAGFNLLLYIVASHVLGAFWYFFSIQREMACWHLACDNHNGCIRSSSSCGHHSGNYTFINEYCPVQEENSTMFDFGIFLEALQSGTVASRNFPRKLLHSFWWGLRNLSSSGQNLQTSPYIWENCFTVMISIFGLLLFLYFIGNLQIYMEDRYKRKVYKLIETTRNMDKEVLAKMTSKEDSIELWMERNNLPEDKKEKLKSIMQNKLRKKKYIDTERLFLHVPVLLKEDLKRTLCLPILKKVPMLKNRSVLSERICKYLKPVYFNEHTYIFREGEPIDMMLLITQGIVFKFPITSTSSGETVEYIEGGHFYGIELLQWATGLESSSPPSLSKLPISTTTLKTHTKVEAFGLMATDLKNFQLSKIIEESAVLTIQSACRHFLQKRKEKKHEDKSLCQEYCFNCLRFRRSSS